MNSIVAIDPGRTCGYARLDENGFSSREFADPFQAVDFVRCWPPDLVACESFTPRAGIRTWEPEALYVIGALKFACSLTGAAFELQSPAQAKRFGTNEKLAALGWRRPTAGGHADDAARHLLLAAVRHGMIPASSLTGEEE